MEEYRLIKKYPVHQGNVMDFYECEMGLANDETAKWDLVEHPGGAAVLPIDKDGSIILVRQYRVGADEKMIEIPAGKADAGESHIDCIRRELKEEIGCVSCKLELLCEFMPAPAYSSEKTDIFLATDIELAESDPDDDEYIDIIRLSVDDVKKMIRSKEITDGKTIAGFMTYLAEKQTI